MYHHVHLMFTCKLVFVLTCVLKLDFTYLLACPSVYICVGWSVCLIVCLLVCLCCLTASMLRVKSSIIVPTPPSIRVLPCCPVRQSRSQSKSQLSPFMTNAHLIRDIRNASEYSMCESESAGCAAKLGVKLVVLLVHANLSMTTDDVCKLPQRCVQQWQLAEMLKTDLIMTDALHVQHCLFVLPDMFLHDYWLKQQLKPCGIHKLGHWWCSRCWAPSCCCPWQMATALGTKALVDKDGISRPGHWQRSRFHNAVELTCIL